MHICFLSSMHPATDKRVFEKEAISLQQAGYKISHICPSIHSGIEDIRGVNIITYPKPSGIKARLGQLFKLYKLAKNLDADVYHCNEVDSWFVGVLLRIFRGKKCVFDVHEHYPSTFAESRFPKWFQPIVSSIIKLIFILLTPLTTKIVLAKKTVSNDFHCSSSKKVLVRNFTLLSGLKFSDKRKELDSDETVTLVHLGVFSKLRGWPQVLEALNLMNYKNIKLEIIGEINDGTVDEFNEMVKFYGLEEIVTLYDWMPFDKAFKMLTNAQIGLIAFQPGTLNHTFAMPHKMFDYMAAGMAVICPDFAIEVAPVISESKCGLLIEPSNPNQIASALDELVSNPSIIHSMGERGQEAVKRKYNWEAEAEVLVRMYKEIEKSI